MSVSDEEELKFKKLRLKITQENNSKINEKIIEERKYQFKTACNRKNIQQR